MKTTLHLVSLMTVILFIAGCQSAETMLDQGRYDDLLSLAQRKMSGKKIKKTKYVMLVEEAFEKVTKQDMERIERLKSGNRSEDWEQIVAIATRIDRRQERLEPFLPLVDENGYQARFTFVKTHDIVQYAENQIVEKLYDEGVSFLKAARNHDKDAARNAYSRFDEILEYRTEFLDARAFREEARALGIVRVLLQVDNKARQFMPGYVADVLDESVSARDEFWTQFYAVEKDGAVMDYVATLVVSDMEIGPEVIREERLPKKKKIEDGWEYVLDERGNVAKDSLGNDIKKTRYTEVNATILKTHQEKGAYLRGRLELTDVHDGRILETFPLQVESRFYHQAQTFFGDERALDKSDRVQIGLIPFPGDESMMLKVAELVRPAFTSELAKSRYL